MHYHFWKYSLINLSSSYFSKLIKAYASREHITYPFYSITIFVILLGLIEIINWKLNIWNELLFDENSPLVFTVYVYICTWCSIKIYKSLNQLKFTMTHHNEVHKLIVSRQFPENECVVLKLYVSLNWWNKYNYYKTNNRPIYYLMHCANILT